jgi:nitroreductase
MTRVLAPELIQQLNWRYATKVFDPARKIPAELWEQLEQALVLTPSSFGLQPYRFIVVTDPALKAKLRPASWNQSQIEDCSHLVVFLAQNDMTEASIDEYLARIAQVRGVTAESLSGYRSFMVGDLVQGPRHAIIQEWAARQTYIALGNFMTSAAVLGVDTCPLEGLVPAQYDEILGLAGSGYRTVCACPAGYRSEADKYATLPKVRYAKDRLITHR